LTPAHFTVIAWERADDNAGIGSAISSARACPVQQESDMATCVVVGKTWQRQMLRKEELICDSRT
jgi:hypothetical protein